MSHHVIYAALVMAGLASVSRAEPPLSAHGVFVSRNYALSFVTPPGLTYCRLSDGWTGSDHGTVLFLSPPRSCSDAGYPSSSRGFEPEATPRIEIFYGHWDNDMAPPPPCPSSGHVRFLGRTHPLCIGRRDEMSTIEVTAHYVADSTAEAIVTLVTSPLRLHQDVQVLEAVAGAMRVCTIPWRDAQGRRHWMGSGQPCPVNGDFY